MVNTVPSNHTHADAELVERARIYRYLLAQAEAHPGEMASLALEQAAEAIDEGEHHRHHAAMLESDQPAPSGGWGDCWEELLALAGSGHALRNAMVARRAAGVVRYGQPLRRDDGRDANRDLHEELLDSAVYAQRVGLSRLAVYLLDVAANPAGHDAVITTGLRGTLGVLREVWDERARQDAKWGEQNHPFFGDEPWHLLTADLEATARQELERSPTYAAILMEEVCEAMRESNADRLRAELIQVAAVAVAAVAALDRRSPPRAA